MEKKYTICIGRQYGSGGREIGELVARKLGVTCYDKLLIQEAAKKSGMDTQFLATHEETMKDMLLPISGNPFADTADMSGLFYFAGDHAYNAEKQAITEIAQRESSVMIGRCASSILASQGNVLSVFLYGNEGDCIDRIAARNGLNKKEAREPVLQFLCHDRVGQAGKLRRHALHKLPGHPGLRGHHRSPSGAEAGGEVP